MPPHELSAPFTLRRFLRRHWPLLAALLILWFTVALLLALSLRRDGGRLVYALDDAYINMAMAKNLSQHGVWGVTPYGFTSSSSSPLWTLLLGLTYWVFGVNSLSPLVLNLIFASLALLAAYAVLRPLTSRATYTFAALMAVIYLAPLPAAIFAGMEHTLHMALTLLASSLAARILTEKDPAQARRHFLFLLTLAPVLTATRPEGLFFVLVTAGLFLVRRGFAASLALGICGLLPIVVYGIVSLSHGWYVLPSPVLLKGNFLDLSSAGSALLSLVGPVYLRLKSGLHLVTIIFAALFLRLQAAGEEGRAAAAREAMTATFVVTALLHLEFADVGWFYRYEAYLVAWGLVVVAAELSDLTFEKRSSVTSAPSLFPKRAVAAVLAAALLFPLLVRGTVALGFIPQAANNIFEQQYQMGLFVRRFYSGSSIALNDVGAVNFLADVHCLDLWGLASLPVTAKRHERNYHTEDIAELAPQAGVRIAIVYDAWYAGEIGGLPKSWVRVGQWTIPNNVVVGDTTVSIYAADASEVPVLVQHLREFRDELPRDVRQSGLYTETPGALPVP